jgi:hypothetical protein
LPHQIWGAQRKATREIIGADLRQFYSIIHLAACRSAFAHTLTSMAALVNPHLVNPQHSFVNMITKIKISRQ